MSLIRIARQIATVPDFLRHLEDQVRDENPALVNSVSADELNVLKRLVMGKIPLVKLCTEGDGPPIEENWWIT